MIALKVSPTHLTALILGETRIWKGVVAHAIYQASARSANSFIVIDCGTIPSSLAEAILFRQERGAFTRCCRRSLIPLL
ncbi:sigma 54-interacting transcriptional regulator [Pajaroellobacter abortibovis]|uniref:Sigma-54 factor interaction domain-containing protein n=1 Tax=Pajaroellobacter abortibovis TaxID=1882918 RepID=A0A1L6MVQ1_9BACT|nr:sigma 54-interacting transcriptional regulator [Pajaroellobacter abortibovis]APR99485.1 hypothetical protein BCY86_01405 [Pajaroellobacter abortibovis]